MLSDPGSERGQQPPLRRSWSERIALGITFGMSPPVLLPVLLWSVLSRLGADKSEKASLVTGAVVLLAVVPSAFLVWMVRSGRARSLNLDDRRQRTTALALSLVCGALLLALVWAGAITERRLVISLMLAYLLTVALLMVINRFWRISLHAASAGAFASVMVFVVAWYGSAEPGPGSMAAWLAGSALLITLVAWSRLRLRAHTGKQVAAGAAVGLLAPWIVLLGLLST